MTLLEFLKGLPEYMNDFQITLKYVFEYYCNNCGSILLTEDDEYSDGGEFVQYFKDDTYSKDYDWIYDEDVNGASSSVRKLYIDAIERSVYIEIVQHDYAGDGRYVCEDCRIREAERMASLCE